MRATRPSHLFFEWQELAARFFLEFFVFGNERSGPGVAVSRGVRGGASV